MAIKFATVAAPALALAAVVATVPAPAVAQPYGPDTCLQGYVWREAAPGDNVCVTPAVRDAAQAQNANAVQNRDPNGAYGSNSCKQGFVWREAFDGDVVCVTPDVRSATLADNAAAASRKASNSPDPTPQPQGGPRSSSRSPGQGPCTRSTRTRPAIASPRAPRCRTSAP